MITRLPMDQPRGDGRGPSSYQVAILAALNQPHRWQHVYAGTVPAAEVERRRVRNRAARRSRRVHRKAAR